MADNYDVTKQDHYTIFKIQPVEYIIANKLDFCEGNVIKYVSRWKHKDGIKDLKKAIRNIEMIINREENRNPLDNGSN
jgi:hypothetical protein